MTSEVCCVHYIASIARAPEQRLPGSVKHCIAYTMSKATPLKAHGEVRVGSVLHVQDWWNELRKTVG